MALSACAGTQGIGVDQLARVAAKEVVGGIVQTRLPGVNVAPLTDCIIDQASGNELLQIAQSAALGSNAETTQLVVGIAQRPETIRCAAQDVLGPLAALGL
jgi:hypothetical protein